MKRANEEEVDNDEKEADDDEDDLEADYRLLKKDKKGKLLASRYFHLPDFVSSYFLLQKKSKATEEDFDRQIDLENVEDDI